MIFATLNKRDNGYNAYLIKNPNKRSQHTMGSWFKTSKEEAINVIEREANCRAITIDIWEAYDINGKQVSVEEV